MMGGVVAISHHTLQFNVSSFDNSLLDLVLYAQEKLYFL